MTEKYKLIYFNSKGRAELPRYLFAYAGERYEDFRFELTEWQSFIPKTPFNYVPVLEVRNPANWTQFEITGQMAISRFLAHRFRLCGDSEENRAMADMIVHQVVNLFEGFAFIAEYEANEMVAQEQYRLFVEERIPMYLELLEAFVEKRGTKFLVSDEVTWADLAFACFFDNFGQRKESMLYAYKRVSEADRLVNSLPAIVKWKKDRKN